MTVTDDLAVRFFESSLDLFCIGRPEGALIHVNPAWTDHLLRSTDEIIATPFLDLVHPDDRLATVMEVQQLLDGYPMVDFVNRLVARGGEVRSYQWTATFDREHVLYYAVARPIASLLRVLDSTLDMAHRAEPCATIIRDVLRGGNENAIPVTG